MRHALASLVLALFLFPALALGETIQLDKMVQRLLRAHDVVIGATLDHLVRRDGLYYKKFTNVPFSGLIRGQQQIKFRKGKLHGPLTVYYRNGQLKCNGFLTTETTIKDIKENKSTICWSSENQNLKQGEWVHYHENGQLGEKGTYKDGKADGPWVYYLDNGQLGAKGTYKDGKEDGPWVNYHDNGQLWEKGTYKDGKRDGPWVFYRENGGEDLTGATSTKYYVHEGSGTYKDGKKISN